MTSPVTSTSVATRGFVERREDIGKVRRVNMLRAPQERAQILLLCELLQFIES